MTKSLNVDIFAPCDCDVAPIEKLNDGVFSKKMLGEGIYITPKDNIFYSPLKEGVLELILESKQAFYFKHKNGPIILMHIGIDTVGSNGEPFEIITKVKSKITLENKIVDVNLNWIKENNLSTSTPIVVDQDNHPGWILKWNKTSSAKKGEKIAELVFQK